jgi:hypothetical protein
MEKRKRVRSFEDLIVWQMGIDLVKRVYLLTAKGTFSRDFGLRDQIRRNSFHSDKYRRRFRAGVSKRIFAFSKYSERFRGRGKKLASSRFRRWIY